jgi:hypothetical protein
VNSEKCENICDLVLSTAYLAPVQYYSKILQYKEVFIERFENYSKQSYRNRCVILAANGPLSLIIPVRKGSIHKTLISDIKIDYSDNWQKLHLKSIESAYNSSPFYQYYIDDLRQIFEKRNLFLIDFNSELQEVILKSLHIKNKIHFTGEYLKSYPENTCDMRDTIHPKKDTDISNFKFHEYYQVFGEKFGFVPGLSIIDLLFNMGNSSVEKLRS